MLRAVLCDVFVAGFAAAFACAFAADGFRAQNAGAATSTNTAPRTNFMNYTEVFKTLFGRQPSRNIEPVCLLLATQLGTVSEHAERNGLTGT